MVTAPRASSGPAAAPAWRGLGTPRGRFGPRGRVPGTGARAGFTLIEVLIAVLLLGCAALGAASAEAWAARMTALAEAREAGAAAAELVLDSLAALPHPTSGGRSERGLRLEWVVVPAAGGSEVRLQVATTYPAEEAWYGVLAASPPAALEAAP